jgi:hypothetical protein
VIRDASKILPSFGDPEAIAAMQAGLGELLDISDTRPPMFFNQVFAWHD